MITTSYLKGIAFALALVFAISGGSAAANPYLPGDANSSGAVDIDDVVHLIDYIFSAGPAPVPIEAGDADCSNEVDIDDVVYLIAYIFDGGPEPCADPDPSGSLVGAFGCKMSQTGFRDDDSLWFRDCIEYQYDGEGTLTLRHINAGFNCCPEIAVDIRFDGDTIIIEDIELSGDCDCICLFDLDYEIVNLATGTYAVTVIEPYVEPGDDPLEFVVDLSSAASGVFCVYRYHYPWGVPQP